MPIAVADQVSAGDVTPNAAGRIESDAGLAERAGGEDQPLGNDLILKDLLLVIDVVDKEIQRIDTLLQAPLDPLPFRRLDDARDDVEGENPFRPGTIAVHVERNAHV